MKALHFDPVLARRRARRAGWPAGAYWDGGITDFHLNLNYAAMSEAWCCIALQPQVEPG